MAEDRTVTVQIPMRVLRSAEGTPLYRDIDGLQAISPRYRRVDTWPHEQLYVYDGDVPGGPATGVVHGQWESAWIEPES